MITWPWTTRCGYLHFLSICQLDWNRWPSPSFPSLSPLFTPSLPLFSSHLCFSPLLFCCPWKQPALHLKQCVAARRTCCYEHCACIAEAVQPPIDLWLLRQHRYVAVTTHVSRCLTSGFFFLSFQSRFEGRCEMDYVSAVQPDALIRLLFLCLPLILMCVSHEQGKCTCCGRRNLKSFWVSVLDHYSS